MGRVIEIVSGQPFDVFLQERLFDPIGMASTWFRVPEAQAARLTTNYAGAGGCCCPSIRAYLDLSRQAAVPVRRCGPGQQPARL
jgi:CubicO group peptidase (beta-lactamase class C family)